MTVVRPFEARVGPHRLLVEGRIPETPTGSPILCLGGVFDGAWMYRRFVEVVARRGRPVYAMSLRGQCGSEWGDVGALGVEEYLADVRAVRAALGIGHEAVLVGYSIGGPLMLAAAAEERARAVVLYDPDPVREVGRQVPVGRFPREMRFHPPKRIVEEMWGGRVTNAHYGATLDLFKRTRFSGRAFGEIVGRLLSAPPEQVAAPVLIVGVNGRNAAHARFFDRYRASWYVFERYSHGMILFSPYADVVGRFVASWLEAGCPTGRRRFFARAPRPGAPHRMVLRAEDSRLRLRYLTGWRHPRVRLRGRGGRVLAEVPMREAGAGRAPGERSFEAEFLLPAGTGFEVAGDGGAVDRGYGGALYRPRADSILLADGAFHRGAWPEVQAPARFETLDVRDDALDHTFRVDVWLPPNYDPRHRYPLALFADGQNIWTHKGAKGGWWADRTAAWLARAGRIPPIVVVGVHCHKRRPLAYLPPPLGRADLYVAFLRRLLADLRNRYALAEDPRRTAAIGASYGAVVSVFAALEAPDLFGLVGSMSFPYLKGSPIRRRLASLPRLPWRRLYLDAGTRWAADQPHRDDYGGVTLDLMRLAEEKGMIHGLDLRHVVGKGDFHHEPAWRRRLPGCLEHLFHEPV